MEETLQRCVFELLLLSVFQIGIYVLQVKQKLRQTCERLLRDVPNIRIGIMANGDYCDYSNYVVRFTDLTSDVDTVVNFVNTVPSTGGGGNGGEVREKCACCLSCFASNTLSWRS